MQARTAEMETEIDRKMQRPSTHGAVAVPFLCKGVSDMAATPLCSPSPAPLSCPPLLPPSSGVLLTELCPPLPPLLLLPPTSSLSSPPPPPPSSSFLLPFRCVLVAPECVRAAAAAFATPASHHSAGRRGWV